jgi:lipid-A-disaccharide synthase
LSQQGDQASPLDVYLVAGEQSGDELGARLMASLRIARPEVHFRGVGGPAMTAGGLQSLFPMSDIAVMGFLPVIAKLPTLLARIRETADEIIARSPDALVIIDSPDFTHRVARRVRKALPALRIIDYVSPTVWAWRPGRARKMRAYVDHVLALLPFEPDAHRRLGGPACTYVGHPLIERLDELRGDDEDARARAADPPSILILPGSRRSEIAKLLDVFGETVDRVAREIPDATFVLPAVAHLEADIRARVATWRVQPKIVTGDAAKFAAFRRARAALAASGTVTLELALAGVPAVVGYRVPKIEELIIRALATASSFVLSNIVLGENAIPGFLQEDCNPGTLAATLMPILRDGPERAAQLAALSRLDAIMRLPNRETPSARAAQIILDIAENEKRPPEGGL